MADSLDQVVDGFAPRGLAPPWYAAVFLPTGLAAGFINVTMGYLLVHHGVGVSAVAAMVALYSLPTTWKFLVGPVLDTSLSPTAWYLISLALSVLALVAMALTPFSPAAMPLLSAIALLMGVAVN